MRSLILVLVSIALATGVVMGPVPAHASHLANKTIVLIGPEGRALGETPWDVLREQFELRGFPESQVLEFQYTGGTFAPDGSWKPNPGGICESYSKASFLLLRQMMSDLAQVRPDHEIFLVGYSLGGFVATQALWLAAGGQDDPAVWQNLTGIVSISGPMAGLSTQRAAVEFADAGQKNCVDLSMIEWMREVGSEPNRYAATEARAAAVMAQGYKIGSFGNTLDCFYKYISDDICPKIRTLAGERAALLRALQDERPTQFIKNGNIYREYEIFLPAEGELVDNHRAVLLSTGPMAELAEFVLSQTR